MFYIYSTVSFKLHRHNFATARYATERAAKGQLTKLVKKGELVANEWAVIECDKYNEMEPVVSVKSLMTGERVDIPLRQRGTVCDPSMESYWSM